MTDIQRLPESLAIKTAKGSAYSIAASQIGAGCGLF